MVRCKYQALWAIYANITNGAMAARCLYQGEDQMEDQTGDNLIVCTRLVQ